MRREEAEAVVAVDLGYYGSDLVECRRCEGVEETFAEACHIRGEAVDAVGVDATEIGENEGFGYNRCIFWKYTVALEDALGEGESGGG